MIIKSHEVGDGSREDWITFLRLAKEMGLQVNDVVKTNDPYGRSPHEGGLFAEVASIDASEADIATVVELASNEDKVVMLIRERLHPRLIGFSKAAKAAAEQTLRHLKTVPGLEASEHVLLIEESLEMDKENRLAAYTDHGKYVLLMAKDFLLSQGSEAYTYAELIHSLRQDEYWSYRPEVAYFVDGEFRSQHMTAQYFMDAYGLNIGEAYTRVASITRHR